MKEMGGIHLTIKKSRGFDEFMVSIKMIGNNDMSYT